LPFSCPVPCQNMSASVLVCVVDVVVCKSFLKDIAASSSNPGAIAMPYAIVVFVNSDVAGLQ